MLTFRNETFHLDISLNCLEEYIRNANRHNITDDRHYIVDLLMPFVSDLIDTYAAMNGIAVVKNKRMLDAHGCIYKGKYIFKDDCNFPEFKNDTIYEVSEWIKKHENQNELLYINVCNYSLEDNTSIILPPAKCAIMYPLSTSDIARDLIAERDGTSDKKVIAFLPAIK